jgi:glucans biosynthesis protein C
MAVAFNDSGRIHYLDNLRGLAMLLGVYLHGALAYAEPSRSIWIASNPQGNVAIDASIWWIHLFRMNLFFLLSGYFSQWMIQRKGLKPYLWNRGVRIVMPFVLFWPLLWAAMAIVFVFAFSYVKEPQGLLRVIADASQNPDAVSSETRYTTMHLWFLYYLLMFSLIGAVASRWTRVTFDWLFQRKWLLACSPLVLVVGVMGEGFPSRPPNPLCPHGGRSPTMGCSTGLAGNCLAARFCWIACSHGVGFCWWQASSCSCLITFCYLSSTSLRSSRPLSRKH